ncbi:MAG: class I SAM-dependent methyltransferase [Anaerolineales bacterium]|nr:class I SAM-dependent methyltransferase [Anaerolineales bacterium]MCB8954637.1 class I SAM-dependent methyltransferase [Ardenticatenales bacterium]
MLTLDQQNALRDQYRRQRPNWQPATEQYATLVRTHLPRAGRLLDLGCGRGGLVEQLAHPLPQIIGIDPDLASLREHRLPQMPRAVADSYHLPLPSGCATCATASWVLEHMAQPARDLREIARVLQPGGCFIFVTPNKRHPLIALNRLLGRISGLQQQLVGALYGRAAADTFPAFYRANTADDLARLATQAGMRLVTLLTIADPSYWGFMPALFPLMCRLEERLPPSIQLHLVGIMQRPTQGTPTT